MCRYVVNDNLLRQPHTKVGFHVEMYVKKCHFSTFLLIFTKYSHCMSFSISKNTTYMDASVIIGHKASTMSAG